MMKKLFLLILVISVSFGMVYSQSITVTNPHSGQTWHKGSAYNITWTKSGAQNANVKIRLYRGATKVLGITDSTANNGSFHWTIPNNIANGNYVIRVKTIDNKIFDNSNSFQISNAPVKSGSIKITNPNSGQTWHKGSAYNITWTKSGSMNTNVKIRLYDIGGTKLIMRVTDNTPNNGSFKWKVPNNVANGNYVIRVKTIDNKVFDDSNVFTIKSWKSPNINVGNTSNNFQNNKTLNPNMKNMKFNLRVVNPNGNSNWKEGKTYQIRWERKYIRGKRINIFLMDYYGKKIIKKIKTNLHHLGIPNGNNDVDSYNWTISKGFWKFPGNYRVKVETIDKNSSGISEPFHITPKLVTKVYKIYAATSNKVRKRGKSKGSKLTGGAPFLTSYEHTDPGNGKLRVGYANFYSTNMGTYSYVGYIYRAHAFFDLNKFKGKGLITKAVFHFNHYEGKSCGIKVYKVNKATSDIFAADMNFIDNPKEPTTGNIQIIQKWVAYPTSNFGIIFVGSNESYSHNHTKCVDYYNDVWLEIEILEKGQ